MAAPTVTTDITRVHQGNNNTNWGHWGGSGGAPASEAPLAYQNGTTVNKLSNATTYEGLDLDPAPTVMDMSTATGTDLLWFVKVYVTDAFDLQATDGLQVGIGSSNSAFNAYTLAGTDENSNTGVFAAYPAQGGYILTAINPNNTTWPDATDSGTTPTLTAIDWYGARARFVNGDAKSENLALDSIDVGRGLYLVGGDGVSTDATFQDFIDADEGTNSATGRYGVVKSLAGIFYAYGLLVIGRNATGTAVHTDFTDSTSIVAWPDGYVEEGDLGVEFDISDVGSICSIGATLIGGGSLSGGNDTRPDFTVTDDGTPGSLTVSANVRNFRNIVLTDQVDVDGADMSFADMTVAGAEIQNSVLRTTSATNVAAINDAVFGVTTDIHDTEFIQEGAGHAVVITAATQTITLTNMTWTGYNASDNQADSAIEFTGTGPHIVNWSGGNAPSVQKNGETVTVQGSVTLTLQNVVSGSQCGIYAVDNDEELMNEAAAGGDVTETYTGTTPRSVYIRVRKASSGTKYKHYNATGQIVAGTGLTLSVDQIEDTIIE